MTKPKPMTEDALRELLKQPQGKLEGVPFDKIVESPYQTRRFSIRDKASRELAASIRKSGVLQPILLRPIDDDTKFEIVFGHRRARIVREVLGLDQMPDSWHRIAVLNDDEAEIACMLENLQRVDLDVLEESEQLAAALEKNDVKTVAKTIGKSPAYVARRARLHRSLSPAWRASWKQRHKLRENGEPSPIAEWSIEHLLSLARVEPVVQDEFQDWHDNQLRNLSARRLDEAIAERTLELSKAPFNILDEDLVDTMPACTGCATRASQHPALFDLPAAGKGKLPAGDRCLNRSCYQLKEVAGNQQAHAKAFEKYGDSLLLVWGQGGEHAGTPLAQHWRGKDVISHWHYETSTKKDKKAQPAFVVAGAGAGHVIFVKLYERQASQKRSGPKSVEERLTALKRRRVKLAVANIVEAAEQSKKVPTTKELIALAITIGTYRRQTYCGRKADVERDVEKISANAQGDLGSSKSRLWRGQLMPVLVSRCQYHSHVDIDGLFANADLLASLVGLQADTYLEAAEETIKVSRALQADIDKQKSKKAQKAADAK